jgi:RNase adapter protein RapZ
MRLIIVSGRSGAGRSVTLNVLEDLGYYCIDNLPLDLLFELFQKLRTHYEKIAVSIDARNLMQASAKLENVLQTLKTNYESCDIIFLDAENKTLLKRFTETRRKHPLTNEKTTLNEALNIEQTLLQPIADHANLKIETSHLNVHQLRDLIISRIKHHNPKLSILLQSFGYKYGTPMDSDFIFDVRCLPNPYWEKELTNLIGSDKKVIKFLEEFPQVTKMYESIKVFLDDWLETFAAENRKYLTISIGCTGGQHRSVYLIEKLKQHLEQQWQNISVRHRELI